MEDTGVELKGMVLAFAAQVALRCVDAVTTTGLHGGGLDDTVEAGGVEWHVFATFDRDDQIVRVTGHPHRDIEDQPVTFRQLVFGSRPDDDSFDFRLPVEWLPRLVP